MGTGPTGVLGWHYFVSGLFSNIFSELCECLNFCVLHLSSRNHSTFVWLNLEWHFCVWRTNFRNYIFFRTLWVFVEICFQTFFRAFIFLSELYYYHFYVFIWNEFLLISSSCWFLTHWQNFEWLLLKMVFKGNHRNNWIS